MTFDEFRIEMESFRRDVDSEADSLKDPQYTLDQLYALYNRLDESEQAMADQVLEKWALSEDEGLRFDALALIGEFKIKKAIPSLQLLMSRLKTSNEPSTPYELEKVARILDGLS